jgi:D-tyrosyl-tRNA(Tyr) deacylase
MKILIQKTLNAEVIVDAKIVGKINKGLLVFLGIVSDDNDEDIDWLVKKIIQLRIFEDENNLLNLSIKDINGEILVVSQFTLHASTKKGNRPSYIKAAKQEISLPIYNKFLKNLELQFGKNIKKGIFGAQMQVKLVNDGPITLILDSKQRD